MTRRKGKQGTGWYVTDGDAGTVWVIQADEDGLWSTEVFENEQIAKQFADWLRAQHNWAPIPQAMKIRTRMKLYD